jgi:hypothetical protein
VQRVARRDGDVRGGAAAGRSPGGRGVVFIFPATYLAVAAIVLLVGIELDEQLRKNEDVTPGGLPAIARSLF